MSPEDFASGPVVENPPSNAGHMGSIPGQRTKMPRAAGQLSPSPELESLCAMTAEPWRRQKTQCAATKTRSSQINIYILKKKLVLVGVFTETDKLGLFTLSSSLPRTYFSQEL